MNKIELCQAWNLIQNSPCKNEFMNLGIIKFSKVDHIGNDIIQTFAKKFYLKFF